MKKSLIIALFISASLHANSMNSAVLDSGGVKNFIHNLNFTFQWFEIGKSIAFKQKQFESLGSGLNKYTANMKGGMSFAVSGPGVYYKDMIGIEVVWATHSMSSDGEEFKAYLSDKYPDYYLPNGNYGFSSSINGWGMRVCYRKHFKRFFIEPKFQYMINPYFHSIPNFRLKQIGTNQYIDLASTSEMHGHRNSYHLILNVAKRFNPFNTILKFELGLMAEFMIAPINESIRISETPYGQVGVTNTESFKVYNPMLNIGITGKMFLGN